MFPKTLNLLSLEYIIKEVHFSIHFISSFRKSSEISNRLTQVTCLSHSLEYNLLVLKCELYIGFMILCLSVHSYLS